MGWYISNDDEHVRLTTGRVVGRDDFVEAPALSRRHLQFTVGREGLTVRDLGSTNGTVLRGERLTPEREYPLAPGDRLSVDDMEFAVDWHRPNITIALSLAAGLVAWKLAMPDAAWGRGISRFAYLSFAASALSASILATVFIHFIVPERAHRTALLAAFALAMAFDFAQLNFLARRTRLVETLVHRRLEHFCIEKFDGRRCVAQVQLCPTCAARVEKWKRELIVRRLAAADRHQPVPER